jgi:enoyl-CoA hydratase/carnithine racemase
VTTIKFERTGAVGSIILSSPPYNRVNRDFPINLAAAIREAGESDIRALVVRAEGPNFCLGGDVRQWPDKDINWFRTFTAEVHAAYRAIEGLRIPTIASVRGTAMGGGFELVLACDFIVAADDARFQCVEVIAGQLPLAGGIQRLADAIGSRRAVQMAMLGEPVSGQAAFDLGFVNFAVPDAELDQATQTLAERLAAGPTLALATVRSLMKIWSSGGTPAADASMIDITIDLFKSQDTTKAFAQVAKALEAGETIPPTPSFIGA